MKPRSHTDCTICARIPVVRGTQQEYHEKHHLRMSNPTPGPWRRQGAIIWGAEIQREVARVKTQPGEPLQDNANARLIASAPELLTALKALQDQFNAWHLHERDTYSEYDDEVLNNASAAIAKAEGKE